MQNLRDKLLKAGLVSPEEAKQAEEARKAAAPSTNPAPHRERPERPAHRSSFPSRPASAARPASAPAFRGGPRRDAREAAIPKLPPLAGSKAHQRQEAAKQREIDRQLLTLVTAGQVPLEP